MKSGKQFRTTNQNFSGWGSFFHARLPKRTDSVRARGWNMATESESPVMAEAMNKFAFDLHKCSADCKPSVSDNLFYSPASLFVALGMTSY